MVGMHVHHRIPVSKGGTNDPSNLYVCSPWFHREVWHSGAWYRSMISDIHPMLGKNHSQESRDKISKGHMGLTQSRKTREKRSKSIKSFWENQTEEYRKEWGMRSSEKLKGKSAGPCTERRKQLLSEYFTGYEFPKVECPHCHKVGAAAPMKRWHFENCKHKHA
jgi:hypothetical protein